VSERAKDARQPRFDCASEPHRHLARKLQLPQRRLKARLLTQGTESGSVFGLIKPGSRRRIAVSSHSSAFARSPQWLRERALRNLYDRYHASGSEPRRLNCSYPLAFDKKRAFKQGADSG
jgi:hypothetical protein